MTSGCKIEEPVVDNLDKTDKPEVSLPCSAPSETTESIMETIVFSTKRKKSHSESQTQPVVNYESEILQTINKIRIENNLAPLRVSADLCSIAKIRAKEAHKLWSHTRPNGLKVDSLFDEFGLEWKFAGENLAKHTGQSPEVVVGSWMNSESHRKNILNSRFQKCGIGEFVADNTIYIALILSD